MHADDVGRVARRELCAQLRIARPGDDIAADRRAGVLGVELVDHRRDDAAFALGRGDIGRGAIGRAAFAEEALQIDFTVVRAAAAAAAGGEQGEAKCQGDPHRDAVPAIDWTMCFWNRT
jgi:hypothetical protein